MQISTGLLVFALVPMAGVLGERDLRRLNPPDPPLLPGDVRDYRLAPDGRHVVYLSDQDTVDVLELYSVRLDRVAPPVKLNAPLLATEDIVRYAITPDSTRVVFVRHSLQSEGVLEWVPIGGGVPVLVDGPIAIPQPITSGFEVEAFTLDSAQVLYLADRDADGLNEELSIAPLAGGAPTLLAGPLPGNRYVRGDCQITADASRVVFTTGNGEPHEVRSVPLAGGTSTLLATIEGTFNDQIHVTPAGLVVYGRMRGGFDPLHPEIYRVPSDGSQAPLTLVSFGEDAPADTPSPEFAVSPDGERLVYWGTEDTLGVYELYSIALDGTGHVQLSPPLVAGGQVEDDFRISADSEEVVFRADAFTDNRVLLFRAPIDGSAPAQVLNGPLASGGDVLRFALTADGTRAVYEADQDVNNVFELYRVALAGGSPLKLDNGGVAAPVEGFVLAPDSRRVLCFDEQRIFLVPLDGAAAEALNPAPGPEINSGPLLFAGSGRSLFRGGEVGNDSDLWLSSPVHVPLPAGPPKGGRSVTVP